MEYICEICKRKIIGKYLVYTPFNITHIICHECFKMFDTCARCENQRCGFQEDTTEPQIIQKEVRKGSMIASIPMPNPNLIERHCKQCECYDIELWCWREYGWCKNYKFVEPFKE